MVAAFNIRGQRLQGLCKQGRGRETGWRAVAVFETLKVDLTVVLGRTRMPLHMLLRMGRGAVIELEASDSDMVEILANQHPIARGQIVVTGDRISIEVTELIRKAASIVEPGASIGDGAASLLDNGYESA